jgi:poly-gamma-glutamate capsule biosynthesis protein CapA/YwtB (metallophosphatase superfamily)
MMTSVIIGGDVCPINRNLELLTDKPSSLVFGDLHSEFEAADLVLVNLECPLIDGSTAIAKSGPVLAVQSECASGLSRAGVDIVNLANNHIMDHGPEGLKVTLEACSKAGIDTVGAGNNLASAGRVLVKVVNGLRIGFIGLAEHEFSIATPSRPGANPLDAINHLRNIREQKDSYDFLIALVHGGNEDYPFPSPRLQEVCRFLIEQGAGAVICQHSHCAGCYEQYQGGHIVYGQGNLLFDYPGQGREWIRGFLVQLQIDESRRAAMKLIPFVQSGADPGVKRMELEEGRAFLAEIQKRSEAIASDEFVREKWSEFCAKNSHSYMSKLLGYNRLFRFLNRNGLVVRHLYNKRAILKMLNLIQCEAHRDVLITILGNVREGGARD